MTSEEGAGRINGLVSPFLKEPKKSSTMFTLLVLSLTSAVASAATRQAFLREPFDQMATVGEHVTLPCRVSDRRGVLQWTRDDFGLGSDRMLDGFSRYTMTGSDDEGRDFEIVFASVVQYTVHS